ncbi:MAG: 4a-hydroxytetrahydrobiopterin dehydratase [Candidatus Babeliales bacterium]
MKILRIIVLNTMFASSLSFSYQKELMEIIKNEQCAPCEGGVQPLLQGEIYFLLNDFSEWKLIEEHPQKIERTFILKDFIQAMHFVNAIAKVAEREGHHPDIYIFYNKVTIQLYTHAIEGLSANDFILAGLIDEIFLQS